MHYLSLRRPVRKAAGLLIILAVTLFLSSCVLMDKLGFDTYDYMSEEVTSSVSTGSETADEIAELLSMLVTDSVRLPTFESTSDAIREYRDSVLSYMLSIGYSKYSGNTSLIEKASKAYPEYSITQIIPAYEFEATMYRSFGGDVKISHRDSARFIYLSGVDAYICTTMTYSSGLEPVISSIGETEKTYRVYFHIANDSETSAEYFALIIKRDDGTLYIKKLLTADN